MMAKDSVQDLDGLGLLGIVGAWIDRREIADHAGHREREWCDESNSICDYSWKRIILSVCNVWNLDGEAVGDVEGSRRNNE